MASSIPYDPDDLENNPFFSHTDESPIEEGPTHVETITSPVTLPPPPIEQDVSAQINAIESASLTEKEYKQLIPERFIKKYFLTLKLTAIEKNGNKRDNPIIKFDCSTNLSKFRNKKYKDVRRTYNECVKFAKYLSIGNLEVFVPTFPTSSTSYPHGSDDEMKTLTYNIQEWFDRVCSNSILILDEEFIFFVENDFGYSVININKKQPVATGVMRKALKQLQPPYDAFLELAEFRPLIKSIYLVCQKFYSALEQVARIEKNLSISTHDFSNKLNDLSFFELYHPGMKNMWLKFSKIMVLNSDLLIIQSINEMGTLGDGLQMVENDAYGIKESLTNRHLIMRELIQAQQATKSKHSTASKIKSKTSIDPIKVDEAIRSLEQASKFEENLTLQLKRISGEMLLEKPEVLDHFENKFKRIIKTYSLSKITNQRKVLSNLENIRLDIRLIDERGGLSRLNRSNLSNIKHNLPKSQSVKGDSWSSRSIRSIDKINSNRKDYIEDDEDHVKHENVKIVNDVDVVPANEDEIIVDAKNAASLLGGSTF